MNMKMERLMGVLLISTFLLTLTVPAVRAFDYPPLPHLNVSLGSGVIGGGISNTFRVDITLMGEGGIDLDPFWDIAGFDIYMNFDPEILEALDVTVDPDGWFAAFWPGGLWRYSNINNAAGTVRVTIIGLPYRVGIHIAPYGRGRLFSARFHEIGDSYTPVLTDITLRNPRLFVLRSMLNADAGLIDLTSPVGTRWHATTPYHGTPFSLDDWVDADGNSELGPGDDLILTDTSTGLWQRYEMHDIKGTLELTQQAIPCVDDYVWVANFPDTGLANSGLPGRTVTGGTSAAYNGFGTPYWTGNFTTEYPIDSVNHITATFLPFSEDEHTQVLVEGVDYVVHADEDLVELLVPLDVPIINEHWVDGVNNTLNGWPWINYIASSIQSVYRKFPAYNAYYGETEGFATNLGYAETPPSEWWYEPDWPWELEGWWALGYPFMSGPWTWPDGTEWWINYTAASYLTVDYKADIDPTPYYVEFDGTYEEFLALGDPIGTTWNEVYLNSLRDYTLVDWTDSDSSGDITVGDYIDLEGEAIDPTFRVDKLATDIIVDQVRSIDDIDPESPFYGMERIVDVAGFPHPEREMSPWHNSASSTLIPHTTGYLMLTLPTAEFTASPRYAERTSRTKVKFDASGSYDPDGTIVSYEWDFGDGKTETSSPVVEHGWKKKGFYDVTLKVTDNDGLTDSDSTIIAVEPLHKLEKESKNLNMDEDYDGMMNLWALVWNDGNAEAYVIALFTTYDRRTGIRVGPILEATGKSTPGSEINLLVQWDPYDFDWTGMETKYEVFVVLYHWDVGEWVFCGSKKTSFVVEP